MLGTVLSMVLYAPGSMEKEFTSKLFRVEVYISPSLNSTKVFTYGEGSYVFDGDLSSVLKEGQTYRFKIDRRPRAVLLELEEIYLD
jgi:hypothetical protein